MKCLLSVAAAALTLAGCAAFKNIDLQSRRPYRVLLLIAAGIVLVTWLHRYVLVVMAYAYLASGFIEMAAGRLRRRGGRGGEAAPMPAADQRPARDSAAR